MIQDYEGFILESLILESKFEFSDDFRRVLDLMPKDNSIRNYLLSMRGADLNITQNYIDISDNKEEVTFIQDRRAQSILGENKTSWITNSHLPSGKYLSFNKNASGEYNNRNIFELLSFEPQEPTDVNHPIPNSGVVGKILSEAVGPKSGRTYVLFQWNDGYNDRFICLNKDALDQYDEGIKKVYTSNRNPIRIGRLINAIMTAAKQPVTPTQVEQFSNQWKSAWDMMNDAFLKFDIVSGYDIVKWYDENNYESDESTLGGSCMRYDYCQDYFGIYTENSDVVKLVILYSDINGKIVNGKYTAPTIRGRALLWKTNQGDMFMDRVYTNHDSDVELFGQFANKNGWWCKSVQNSYTNFTAYKGGQLKQNPTYTVDLNYADFEYYPYVDTLCYMKLNQLDSRDTSGVLSNNSDTIDAGYELRDTEGERMPI
jgi:hypothetical protein